MRHLAQTTLRIAAAAALTLAALASPADAATVRISADPYSSPTVGAHASEVEPDSFAAGSTIVSAFQVGRTYEGGGANAGWATSTNSGASWTQGLLPNITIAGGGPYARVTDTAVAYDPKHNVWMIASIGLGEPPSVTGQAVIVSRSTDGGLTWQPPVNVAVANPALHQDLDKDWIVCDGTPASPYYGRCYVQWDDFGDSDRIAMSTSADGGLTWGPPKGTAGPPALGLGGQPVAQPNGTVIVPYASVDESTSTAIGVFRSVDGGGSWSQHAPVAPVSHHTVAGPIRSDPLPSAEVDHSGRVYVAWEDCRFRTNCEANDIVIASSPDGVNWSSVRRVPIDPVTSGADHFVPGLAVDPATSGSGAHLGLAYHYLPQASCSESTCKLYVAFVDSLDAGARWSAPTTLAGPMAPNWLAPTSDGFMTGDYISTSFVAGLPHPVFASASAPVGGKLDEAIFAASPPMRGPPPVKPAARKLTNLKIQPSRFSRATGSTVSYNASAAGKTRFRARRRVVRHGSPCGPPRNGKPRTCHVWVRSGGEFERRDAKGRNTFGFKGKVGTRLGPGTYQLVAEPRDPGRQAGKSATARFTMLASRRAR